MINLHYTIIYMF